MEEILHEATTTDVMDEVNLDTVQNGHDASCQPLPAADPIFLSDAANEMNGDDMNDDNNVDDIDDIGDFNAVGHANVSETEIMTPNDDSPSHATSSMPTVDHFMIDETTTTSTTPPPAIQDKDISDIPKNEEDGSTDIPIEPVTVTVPDVDVSHQPEDINEIDHPPPSIGIDCINDTAIPTDRLEEVDVDTTTTDNVMTTVVPPANQIDLGHVVDTTIVQPLSENDTSAENVNQEDFSAFHDTTPLPTVTKTSDFVPMVEDDHDHHDNDEDEDFGDFDDDNAAAAPMDATIPNPNATMNQGDNDFGHFDVATLSTTTSPEVVVIETNQTNIDDDDDDFGDFDTAEAPPMTNEPISVHDNDDNDDDDDDDFGDFDEAPVSVPTTNGDAVHESSASRSAIPSDDIDPIMVKVRNTFSNMFIRYAREENIAATTLENNNDDIPIIPQFDSDEIITIESVLASLEGDVSTHHQGISQSSIYPIEKLFAKSSNETDSNTVTPSRFIISKKTIPSPTMYPFSGHTFLSDRMIRMIVMHQTDGRNAGEHWNPNPLHNIADNGEMKHDVGPSEQAKALLERIPDLSYILSSKLSIPKVKIEP